MRQYNWGSQGVVDQVYQVLRWEAQSLLEWHDEELSVPTYQATEGSNRAFGSLSNLISNQSRLILRVACAPRSGPESIFGFGTALELKSVGCVQSQRWSELSCSLHHSVMVRTSAWRVRSWNRSGTRSSLKNSCTVRPWLLRLAPNVTRGNLVGESILTVTQSYAWMDLISSNSGCLTKRPIAMDDKEQSDVEGTDRARLARPHQRLWVIARLIANQRNGCCLENADSISPLACHLKLMTAWALLRTLATNGTLVGEYRFPSCLFLSQASLMYKIMPWCIDRSSTLGFTCGQ